MTTDKFLHDLQSKQILRHTNRQTLNCRVATLLTMVPPEKKGLSNKKNYENRSICSKIIDKQTLNIHTYIYLYIQTNCITFLPFEVG